MPQAELRQAAMMRPKRIHCHALSSVAVVNDYYVYMVLKPMIVQKPMLTLAVSLCSRAG
jgi:hypothetical protein